MNLTGTKTKNYQDCMKEMKTEIQNIEKERSKQQKDLKDKQKELETVEKKLAVCDKKKNEAVDVLEVAFKALENLREERQLALITDNNHKDISKKIKEKREDIELYEDTATAFVNSSDALSREIEELKAVIDSINTLITELNNKSEVLEAVIEYNEAAEKLAPAYKKVMDILERDLKEGRRNILSVYQGLSNMNFTNVYINNYFHSVRKLYIEEITPDIRDNEGAFLSENLWHYNKDHC